MKKIFFSVFCVFLIALSFHLLADTRDHIQSVSGIKTNIHPKDRVSLKEKLLQEILEQLRTNHDELKKIRISLEKKEKVQEDKKKDERKK